MKTLKSLTLLINFGWCIFGTMSKNETVEHDNQSIFKVLEQNVSESGRKSIGETFTQLKCY